MTSKYDKISHHVRNEMKNLGVVEIDDGAVAETLTQRLILKYKEYESYPIDKFRASVKEAMSSIIAETTISVR
jgi:hypothetical protein